MQQQIDQLHEEEQQRQEELTQALDHIKHLETNDKETRTHIFSMTDQIDQRNQKIEKLEHDI